MPTDSSKTKNADTLSANSTEDTTELDISPQSENLKSEDSNKEHDYGTPPQQRRDLLNTETGWETSEPTKKKGKKKPLRKSEQTKDTKKTKDKKKTANQTKGTKKKVKRTPPNEPTGLELMPDEFNGIQVNGCTNWQCENWGALTKDHKSDTKINYGRYAEPRKTVIRNRLHGYCGCKSDYNPDPNNNTRSLLTFSNQAIQRAIDSTSTETVFRRETSCRNKTCENHMKSIYTHREQYRHCGYVETKSSRKSQWECQSCKKRMVFETTGQTGQEIRIEQKADEYIFRGFIKGLGFRPMSEVFEVSHSTIRGRIDAYTAQAMRWIEKYAKEIEKLELHNPRLETDIQKLTTNWRDNWTVNKDTRGKQGIQLKRVATAHGSSGYILELTHNYDITVETMKAVWIQHQEIREAEKVGKRKGITLEETDHAHWADSPMMTNLTEEQKDWSYERIKHKLLFSGAHEDDSQQVEYSVQKRKKKLDRDGNDTGEWEKTRESAIGILVRENYSTLAHFFKLKRLMKNATYYHHCIDGDSSLLENAVKAHYKEIKNDRVHCYRISSHIHKDFREGSGSYSIAAHKNTRTTQKRFRDKIKNDPLISLGFEEFLAQILKIAQKGESWDTDGLRDKLNSWLDEEDGERRQYLKDKEIIVDDLSNEKAYSEMKKLLDKRLKEEAINQISDPLFNKMIEIEHPMSELNLLKGIPIPNPRVRGPAMTALPISLIHRFQPDLTRAAAEIDEASTHAVDNFFSKTRQNQFIKRKNNTATSMDGLKAQIAVDEEEGIDEIETHIWDPYKAYDPQTIVKTGDIQRFYFNFMKASKRPYEMTPKTPAMRLGIIDHVVSFDEFMNTPFYTIQEGYRDKTDKTKYQAARHKDKVKEILKEKAEIRKAEEELAATQIQPMTRERKAEDIFIVKSAFEKIWGTEKALKRMTQKYDYEVKRKKKRQEQSKNRKT